MKQAFAVLAATAILGFGAVSRAAADDVAVIVHKSNPVAAMTIVQLRAILLGGGAQAEIADQAPLGTSSSEGQGHANPAPDSRIRQADAKRPQGTCELVPRHAKPRGSVPELRLFATISRGRARK